jgi:hypothetical protein
MHAGPFTSILDRRNDVGLNLVDKCCELWFVLTICKGPDMQRVVLYWELGRVYKGRKGKAFGVCRVAFVAE